MDANLLNLYKLLDPKSPIELKKSSMHPAAIEALTSVGWEAGMKVPGGLPEYFAKVLDYLQLPKNYTNIAVAMKYEEVAKTLENAIRMTKEIQDAENIVEGKLTDLLGEVVENNDASVEIRRGAKEALVQQMKEQEMEAVTEDFSDLETDTPEEPASPDPAQNVTPVLTICPCCKCDLTVDYTAPKVTEAEQRDYLIYILGGPAFKKEYKLWNGLITVTFAATGPREEDLFTELYAMEYKEGLLSVPSVSNRKFNQYHVALALTKLEYAPELQKVAPTVPSIWSSLFDPDPDVPRLKKFMDKWYSKTITNLETQYSLVAAWLEFNNLLIQLQQELYNKDFWKGATLG